MNANLFGQPGTLTNLAPMVVVGTTLAYTVAAVFVAGFALGRKGAIR